MNMDEITRLIGALDKSSVSVLELKDGECTFSLKLERGGSDALTTPHRDAGDGHRRSGRRRRSWART